MKKSLSLLLIGVLLAFNLCGCGIDSKASERFYLWRTPLASIEHFFKLELPKETEILEYEYEYARLMENANTIITAKISIPAEEWDTFAESMDEADYLPLDADTDEAKEASGFYDNTDRMYAQEIVSWWDFERADSDGYYGWYVSGYVKHVSTPYLFAITDGDFVTVYLLLII